MTVQFSNYEIDTVRFELRRAGRLIKLQRRPCELLLFLIEHRGQVVGREDIAEKLWGPGVHVDAEHNINTIVRKVRFALNDDAERQRYVKTVVGRGYIFVGDAIQSSPAIIPPTNSTISTLKLPPPPAQDVAPEAASEPPKPSLALRSADSFTPHVEVEETLFLPAVKASIEGFQWRWAGFLVLCCLLWIPFWGSPQLGKRLLPLRGPARPSVPESRPAHPDARAAYLEGRYFWNKRTLDGLQQAIVSFQRAISLDPTYDEAYAGLGDAYVLLSSYGGPEPSKSLSLAREKALKALSLNPHLGEAHTVLAAVKVDLDWDWEGAVKEYQAALRLSPDDPTTHHWYALHLSRLGRHKEAEAEIEQAIQLDPVSLIINTDAAEIYYRAGHLDRATAYLDKVGQMNPDFADSHMIRGEVEEQQRNFAGAVREFQLAETLFHNAPNIIALRGHALALAGERKRALDTARGLERLAAIRYVSAVDIGIVYCGLGDSDTAVKWLQRAYEHHDKGLNILAADPLFLNCRHDPKFSQLLAELHLPAL